MGSIDYARQAEQCSFNLADVACLKVESYGDTTGIAVAGFREMLQIPDRSTIKGIRDYAMCDSFSRNLVIGG